MSNLGHFAWVHLVALGLVHGLASQNKFRQLPDSSAHIIQCSAFVDLLYMHSNGKSSLTGSFDCTLSHLLGAQATVSDRSFPFSFRQACTQFLDLFPVPLQKGVRVNDLFLHRMKLETLTFSLLVPPVLITVSHLDFFDARCEAKGRRCFADSSHGTAQCTNH